VQELQNLYNVAVVGADNKVAFRTVKVGPREGTLWVIDEGLRPGDRVVVEGLQRLRDGSRWPRNSCPPRARRVRRSPPKRRRPAPRRRR